MKPLVAALAVGTLALGSVVALHADGPSRGTGAGSLRQKTAFATSETPATANPFGVAASASSSRSPERWIGPVADMGVGWVRGFNPTLDPALAVQRLPRTIRFSGILEFRDPNDPAAWQAYVRERVQRFRPLTTDWEVWNEPPNFTGNTPPEVYGRMVALAHDAAREVDPSVKLGLAAQSVNLNYMDRALLSGAKDKFDFVTVHPYETASLIHKGFEAQFMAIVPTIRKMLLARNPERAQVPVYFTEVGQPVDARNDAASQASLLVKVYTMGLAQGAARVHWFEPLDGDSGPFGLFDRLGQPRPAHTALRTLIDHLGPQPRVLGWLLLADRHHGFLFEGPQGPVMVAWSRPGTTEAVALPEGSRVVYPLSGVVQATTALALTNLPALVLLPREATDWVQQASANQGQPFPWNGDHSGAPRVAFSASDDPADARGLHLVQTPVWREVGDERVLDAAPRAITSFTVDPNFLSYTSVPLRITAVVRRNSPDAAGFNLKYESRSGTRSVGWNTVPANGEWATLSWSINDPQFVGKFGYHFWFDSDSTRHSNYSIRSVSVSKE